jgi:polyisoprenyl-phosphate glycosyltransferase
MAARKPRLCVVAPCFNEAEVLPLFHAAVRRVFDEQLADFDAELHLVDDGSADGTLDVLNTLAQSDPAVRVYSLTRNFGHQIALTAGLDLVRGDVVVVMDSDLQHPPELIPALVREWRAGADVVAAVRQATAGASFAKRLTSDGFYTLFNRLSDTQLTPGAADFCLLSRRAHRALRRMPERHRFLRGMVAWLGFPRATIAYRAPPRAAGRSKYTLAKMLRFAADALASFTGQPLRLATRFGLLTVAASLLYLLYVLLQAFVFGNVVPGWASVISAVLVLQGTTLFFVGLVGEYLVRVYEESKGRPLYVLKQQPPRPRAARLLGVAAAAVREAA